MLVIFLSCRERHLHDAKVLIIEDDFVVAGRDFARADIGIRDFSNVFYLSKKLYQRLLNPNPPPGRGMAYGGISPAQVPDRATTLFHEIALMIFRYSSSGNAFRVVVRMFPIEPRARKNLETTSSLGASAMVMMS